jgi:hypothetical protein
MPASAAIFEKVRATITGRPSITCEIAVAGILLRSPDHRRNILPEIGEQRQFDRACSLAGGEFKN